MFSFILFMLISGEWQRHSPFMKNNSFFEYWFIYLFTVTMCPDVSLAWLTKALLQEMVNAPDGVLDLRQAVLNLKTRRRRVYDITNVLSSISLIKKESANKVKWMYVCM